VTTPKLPAVRVPADLCPLIDHTLLAAGAREAEVEVLCREAVAFGFHAVCVNPIHIAFAARQLQGSAVVTCSVVAFPFGATTSHAKATEAERAVRDGAGEVDMVLSLGLLKAGRLEAVRDDVAAVRRASGPALLKVILETCLLTDEEKVLACRLCQEAGADFVKTSTGFGAGGATLDDVRLLRAAVGPAMGVKASGGIRTFEAARAMVEAGASRIGASASVRMVGGAPPG
jgi:deoxyribose-phosphate aldolase